MKTRPWPLVIVALLHVVGPYANVLFSAILLNASPWWVLDFLSRQEGWIQLGTTFIAIPLAGLAIYAIKPWSYPVFVAVMAWVLFVHRVAWTEYPGVFSHGVIVTTVLFNLGVVTYLLLPSVRAAYFDRRLRWWETKPRFKIALEGSLRAESGKKKVTIENISEGGAFIGYSKGIEKGGHVTLSFEILGQRYDVDALVVHARASGCGLQFSTGGATRSRLRRLARGLALICEKERPQWADQNLGTWFMHVLMTGEGWVPVFEKPRKPEPAVEPETEKPELDRKAA